jgi:hypothetical protein
MGSGLNFQHFLFSMRDLAFIDFIDIKETLLLNEKSEKCRLDPVGC